MTPTPRQPPCAHRGCRRASPPPRDSATRGRPPVLPAAPSGTCRGLIVPAGFYAPPAERRRDLQNLPALVEVEHLVVLRAHLGLHVNPDRHGPGHDVGDGAELALEVLRPEAARVAAVDVLVRLWPRPRQDPGPSRSVEERHSLYLSLVRRLPEVVVHFVHLEDELLVLHGPERRQKLRAAGVVVRVEVELNPPVHGVVVVLAEGVFSLKHERSNPAGAEVSRQAHVCSVEVFLRHRAHIIYPRAARGPRGRNGAVEDPPLNGPK